MTEPIHVISEYLAIISEYLVKEGRMPITLKRHSTKEGVLWGVWKGKEKLMKPDGSWTYPDRRSHNHSYMYPTAGEAMEAWMRFYGEDD